MQIHRHISRAHRGWPARGRRGVRLVYEVASSVVQVPFPFDSRGCRAAGGPPRARHAATHARPAAGPTAASHATITAILHGRSFRGPIMFAARIDTVLKRPRHHTTTGGAGRGVHADTREGTWTYIGPPKASAGARGGRIRPCVLWWKCTRLRPRADRRSGAVGRSGAAGPRVRVCGACRCARVVAPLLPRMKASPYLALSCPFTYSSVCSIAMFMKPSRHASTPVRRLASSACAKGSRARRHATSVVHARVELDHHRPPKHLLEEVSRVVLCGRGSRHGYRWRRGEGRGQRSRELPDSATQVPTPFNSAGKGNTPGFRL